MKKTLLFLFIAGSLLAADPAPLFPCKVTQDFVHPSGIKYKKGTIIKLTERGAQAWQKEGWVELPRELQKPAKP